MLIERTRVLGHGSGGVFATYDTRMTIADSTFALNGEYAVYVDSAQTVRASAYRTVFTDNTSGFGIRGRTGSDAAGSLRGDVFARNGIAVSVGAGFDDTSFLLADASSSVFADNYIGITVSRVIDKLTLAGNTIVRNAGHGVQNDFNALIESRGNNTIRNNKTDGGPFAPLPGL
jgi:hypothetical protein